VPLQGLGNSSMNGWLIVSALALYVGLLFACAFLGDRQSARIGERGRQWLYALTLGVYCTSWTFYGAVGSAIRDGWSFLPIYLGPLLFLWWGHDLWRRLVLIRARHSISSIADFLAARYGKSSGLAALVTVCAVMGILPYLALQLRAISSSVYTLIGTTGEPIANWSSMGVLILTAGLAGLAMLFGTRQMLASERHGGLMLAVALESAVKLIALLAVALYAVWQLRDTPVQALPALHQLTAPSQLPSGFWAQTLIAALAMLCLPRQFHVSVVECPKLEHVQAARRLFAVYLLLTVLAVLPIAAWALTHPELLSDVDMAVLLLPLSQNQTALALVAFLGGFSAATGMMLVASVALSIMISNDLVLPALWRLGWLKHDEQKLVNIVRWIRRLSLLGLMLMGYGMYRLFDGMSQLASIGLLAFGAVAQFAPALIGGVYWRGGSKIGVMAGLTVGFALWGFTLLFPALIRLGVGDATWLEQGVFGIGLLKPEALLGSHGLDPLTHGVLWSLSVNVLLYIGVSLKFRPTVREQMQALPFLQPEDQPDQAEYISQQTAPSRFRLHDLYVLAERINGTMVTRRAFSEHAEQRGEPLDLNTPADGRWWRMTEQLLAGAIGSASARTLLTTALRDQGLGVAEVAGLLDHASQWQRFNQALLATMMDHMSQGVSVVDADLRLVAWNRRYLELFDYPVDLVYVGCPIADLIRFNAERGQCGDGSVESHIEKRLYWMRLGNPHVFERVRQDGLVIEMRGQPIAGGGFVTTFADITAFRQTEAALEQRVLERTEQLEHALTEQAQARQLADTANLSKSRFVAAASHDLLQPMHAARLFTASLQDCALPDDATHLVQQLDRSLHGAESILSALLDIARLDTGSIQPHLENIALDPLLADLEAQYAPIAAQRGIKLRIHRSGAWVRGDAQWLRRMLQNLLSNALRYTASGRVVMGVRAQGEHWRMAVWDTGMGIDPSQQHKIFDEFQRGQHASPWGEQGLGLGLAITLRMAKRLGYDLQLHSVVGKGSCFWLTAPKATPMITPLPVAAPKQPLQGLRVLCLDNDRDILDGMTQLLRRWGCTVMCATHLAQALELNTQHPADVWLIDQHLDDAVLGVEVLEEYVPIGTAAALITADSDPDLPKRVKDAGAVFLKKPLQPAALRAYLTGLKRQH
jgi:Na+/proline symporter/signal transduction histidine kinase